MTEPIKIFVALENEGTEVWRPIQARALGAGVFEILGIVPAEESWQFAPGTLVRCKEKVFSGGTKGLVAYEAVAV